MSCPTCDKTLQYLGLDMGAGEAIRRVYWCPNCGTIREEISTAGGAQTNDEPPKLVARCREFEGEMPHAVLALWRRVGMAESINTPENRPEAK